VQKLSAIVLLTAEMTGQPQKRRKPALKKRR
jgi:hypothetical protein